MQIDDGTLRVQPRRHDPKIKARYDVVRLGTSFDDLAQNVIVGEKQIRTNQETRTDPGALDLDAAYPTFQSEHLFLKRCEVQKRQILSNFPFEPGIGDACRSRQLRNARLLQPHARTEPKSLNRLELFRIDFLSARVVDQRKRVLLVSLLNILLERARRCHLGNECRLPALPSAAFKTFVTTSLNGLSATFADLSKSSRSYRNMSNSSGLNARAIASRTAANSLPVSTGCSSHCAILQTPSQGFDFE